MKTSYIRQRGWALTLAVVLIDGMLIHTITEAASQDHLNRSLDKVLTAHVTDGRVDYPAIAQDANFDEYITLLKQVDLSQLKDRQEQLVFWINAYNALAIQGILDGKSPSSFFGRITYFKTTNYDVGGDDISLYDLEREVLIPLGEPRMHFAIVCASHSCPKLRSQAYAVEQFDAQLEEGTREFINDSTRNRFDREKKIAYVSKIFDWFDEDFEQHSGSIQRYLALYVDDPRLAKQLEAEQFKIKFLDYDWSLNGIPPKN